MKMFLILIEHFSFYKIVVIFISTMGVLLRRTIYSLMFFVLLFLFIKFIAFILLHHGIYQWGNFMCNSKICGKTERQGNKANSKVFKLHFASSPFIVSSKSFCPKILYAW